MSRRFFYWINIIVPLSLGAAIYLYWRPGAYISKIVSNLFNISFTSFQGRPAGIYRFIGYYLCDALWAYSLIFSLALYLGRHSLMQAYSIGICFAAGIEILQLFPQTPGSFDILDIIVELIVCTITIVIIYLYERRNVL